MPTVNIVIDSEISQSPRVRQLEAIFDVPATERQHLEWKGDLPIDEKPWNVGLIVGPSGCGKSTILRDVFGEPKKFKWSTPSVIDDFAAARPLEDITSVCQSVGFNTIPAWFRAYKVLSNGEQFRADLARRLLETPKTIVVDEFTSVVDRQVAKIGAHAVQKYVRKHERQFVAASCHYDIIDWLQPDWVLEPATMAFQWRSVRRRPEVECEIARIDISAWPLFAPFHYLTADLHRSAKCYGLLIDGRPVVFGAVLYRPHPRVDNIWGLSRLVTLPDYQGLGLAFVLIDHLGGAYKARGKRFNTYPAHPPLIRSFDRSPLWRLAQKPGVTTARSTSARQKGPKGTFAFGGRPNAVFEYVGPPTDQKTTAAILGDDV